MNTLVNFKDAKNIKMENHEIDYFIQGEEMQLVEIELDNMETAIAEAGAFMYMDAHVQMETIFGDGSAQQSGFMGKLLGAGKRLLTGESLFMTAFTNQGQSKARVAFASPYPGKIIPFDLSAYQGKIICQKDAFLCAAKGHIIKRTLLEGDSLKIDTGCIVAYTKDIDFDIQFVGGIKNTFFGGEGIFFATLQGPGEVWLQSLPISRLASRVLSYGQGTRKEEGTGLLGGLGNLIDGD